MNELLKNIKGQIIAQIKVSKVNRITEKDLKNLLDNYRLWLEDNRPLTSDEKSILLEGLMNRYIADLNYENDFVEIERGYMIKDDDPKLHEPWEFDPEKRFYWRKQREFLISVLKKRNGSKEASKIINSIDFETDEILCNMEDPRRKEFDSRGLVVGYVQSGKTANFMALISKAVDEGYRFIIVFAGIHDELRQQTQIRVDKELTGNNDLKLCEDFVEWSELEVAKRWKRLTSAGYLDGKETGEFSGKGISNFGDVFLNKERPVIAIVKKNVQIMKRLIDWISNSEEKDRINVPVLIIDDEADQASIDGNATKADTDPTKTNARIREIIGLFRRTAYIGYTATPFANVFIKHDSEHGEFGDDLYPRNFIHSLPDPKGYFGTKKIFGENLDSLFVKEVAKPRIEKKELADKGEITHNIISSIYSFVIGIAIRSLRGYKNKPMSMMINVDHRIVKMNRVGEVIKRYMNTTLPKHYNTNDIEVAYDNFIQDTEKLNCLLGSENEFFNKNDVVNEVISIIKSKDIEIRVLNSSKEDKLDYVKNPSMKVIAIGGNKLSRGLTLEGLMTTFYLRESKQFDTLLQMGRWFGFRDGYEDLVRIYTSPNLWRQFKDLAIVELEFRDNIKVMVEEEKTPKEFAVGVRQILGLLPTGRNKLGAASLQNYYGGKQVSITRLTLEKPYIIDKNTNAVKELIQNINNLDIKFEQKSEIDYPSRLAENVPSETVLQFLEKFQLATDTSGNSLGVDKAQILNYIIKEKANNDINKWNVAIISIRENEDNNIITLSEDIRVRTVNRARIKTSPINGTYNIKAISSKTDRKIDLSEGAKNEYDGRVQPLLLLYFVSRNSKPLSVKSEPSREDLYLGISEEMKRDPVSYSIIFPTNDKAPGMFKQDI